MSECRHAYDSPELDALVDDVVRNVGREVEGLRIPRLSGVVLGGGYARGEGGVVVAADSGEPPRLSNDLDFYVVTEDGADEADIARIGEMLKPVSAKWTERLGVDVDFCTAKTPWRLRHDQERLMIQELVHGYCDVAGKKGEELFAHVERREPSALPWNEAVRLLVNRGAGLLLAEERGRSRAFVARNINKAVLGAGDARLIASGKYAWRACDRAAALGEGLYSRAVAWKFRPAPDPVCGWEEARDVWLAAVDEVLGARRAPRSLYQAARWLARRRTLGDLRTFGMEPEVRILRKMRGIVAERAPFPPALKKDWQIFN